MKKLKDKIKIALKDYPKIQLWARAAYYSKMPYEGVHLLCYRKGKSVLERYSALSVGPEEVEVETLFTAISTGTEKAMFIQSPGAIRDFPYVPGSSGVGRVTKIGSKVNNINIGDNVVGLFRHGSKEVFPVNTVVKLNDGIDLDSASLLYLALIALQGIRMGRIGPNYKIAIMGQGVIGRLATVLARGLGGDVICITATQKKLVFFGESNGIALCDENAKEKIKEMNAEVVIDATGNPDAINTAIDIAGEGGKIVLLGSNRGITHELDPSGETGKKRLTIVGAHIRNISKMPSYIGNDLLSEINMIQNLIMNKKLSLKEIISKRITCEGLSNFYNKGLTHDDKLGVVLVDWKNSNILLNKLKKNSLHYINDTVINVKNSTRIALIGCGNIGVVNAEAVRSSDGAKLMAVMDIDIDLARKTGIKFDVKYTNNYEAILTDNQIDALLISTPPSSHESIAIQAIQAGKHIIIEKPLSNTLASAISIIKAAKNKQTVLRTFYSIRYDSVIQLSKWLIDNDAIGQLMGISVELHLYRSLDYWYEGSGSKFEPNWRGRKKTSGGGFIISNVIHVLDYLSFITGLIFKTVYADKDTLLRPVKVEDTASLILRGSKQEMITISSSNTVLGNNSESIRLWGDCGQIIIRDGHVDFYSNHLLGEYKPMTWHKIIPKEKYDFRARFIDSFHHQITEKTITGFDEPGLTSMAIVDAAYKSIEYGKKININNHLQKAMGRKCSNED